MQQIRTPLSLWKLLVGVGATTLVAAALGPTAVTAVGRWQAHAPDARGPLVAAEEATAATHTVVDSVEDPVPTAALTRAFSLAMHLHGSISEGDAGWQWHHQQAVTQNLDALWWSDHDTFYYPDGTPSADGYDFEAGSLTDGIDGWPSGTVEQIQWVLANDANPLASGTFGVSNLGARTGTYGGRLSGTASASGVDEQASWYLDVTPHFQYKSLLGGVTLTFSVKPVTTSEDGELQLVVPLNATRSGAASPSTTDYRAIVFYHGGAGHPAMSEDGNTVYVAIDGTAGSWSDVSADLTALAVDAWGEADAYDMHAELATLRLVASAGATVTYYVDDLAWSMASREQDLMDEQSNYLSGLGASPHQYLGVEVSQLPEGHFNVFGEMPFLPYASDDTLDANALSDWAHGYGALVSYNHMFGVSTRRNSTSEREEAIVDAIDRLTADAAWGVDMLEIGYRQRGGTMSDFLRVWDEVGMSGLYLTGIGAMDLHDEIDYTSFTNNFVTYVGLVALSESGAKNELARGNCWFGDPTYFTGGHVTLSIASPEVSALKMGAVVVGRTTPVALRLTISEVPSNSIINLVENGVVTQTWTIATSRRWVQNVTVDPTGGNVVRLEVTSSPGGNPIAYTNPVYFVPSGTTGVPSNRRVVVR